MTADLVSVIVESLIPVMAAPVVAGVTAVCFRVWEWAGKKDTAQDRANMEGELTIALKSGLHTVLPDLLTKGWHDAGTRAEAIKVAVAYLKERFPDRAAQIAAAAGVNTDSLDTQAAMTAVGKAVEARFMDALIATFSVPATVAKITTPSASVTVTTAAPGGVVSAAEPLPATTLPAVPSA